MTKRALNQIWYRAGIVTLTAGLDLHLLVTGKEGIYE
jgi:hypothetical protein